MPWYAWVGVAWAVGCAGVCLSWYIFMRPIRDHEDERLAEHLKKQQERWRG